MKDGIFLTPEQNLCAARVFLNIFGLKLEEYGEFNEYDTYTVFDSNGEDVGVVYFKNGKINIITICNLGLLRAEYDMTKFSIYDGMFINWNHVIKFKLLNNSRNVLGDMQIGCSMETVFGLKCNVHTTMKYNQDEKKVTIKFMEDGHQFKYEINDDIDREVIDVSPCDTYNGFIHHQIDRSKNEDGGYAYTKYSGIQPEQHINNSNLRSYWFVMENGEFVSYEDKNILMCGKSDSEEAVIQKGLLMQQVDSDYVKRIEDIKKEFISGDLSLIDNLIDACFHDYSDAEVKALFGSDRVKLKYQNGADNLVNAYFGIGDENTFKFDDSKKRLLDRKNN